jgi:hydroxyacylglutathione hydrolase
MPYIKQFQNEKTSCLSYYICCPGKGGVAIIDPSEDIEKYLMQAENDFTEICAVIDTHIHGDHISGARRLSQKTGAKLYMPEASCVKFDFEPLAEGGVIDVGNASLKTMLTPGHTLESLSLLYIDHKRAEEPWSVFTGDTLFVGDIGRLDFEGAGTKEQMYDSLFRKLLGLPDYVEVMPAHYIGSVCGSGMSLKTVSTIGFERRFNPALQAATYSEFEKYLSGTALQPFPQHVKFKSTNSGAEPQPALYVPMKNK